MWVKERKDIYMNMDNVPDDILIKRVADLTKSVFRKGLKSVVEGKEWIDVPFDWHGYK